MIRYSVIWTPESEYLLGQFWLRSSKFGEMTSAITDIEQRLSVKPRDPAAEQIEGLWFLTSAPLRVAYEIDDDAMIVYVLNVGWIAQH